MNRKCDYDQKRKLALKTEVLLRENISNMKKEKDIQKRCGKAKTFCPSYPIEAVVILCTRMVSRPCPQPVKGV